MSTSLDIKYVQFIILHNFIADSKEEAEKLMSSRRIHFPRLNESELDRYSADSTEESVIEKVEKLKKVHLLHY